MKNTLKETRKSIMRRAHAMCKEMRNNGYEFDYHVQLGLNIKYLWETVGETVDTMIEDEQVPVEETNTAVEETIEDTEEYDEEEEYEKYENYVEYVVEDDPEEEVAENTKEYCSKGDILGIRGRIQTSVYEKNDSKIYKKEIIAEKVSFLSSKSKEDNE